MNAFLQRLECNINVNPFNYIDAYTVNISAYHSLHI